MIVGTQFDVMDDNRFFEKPVVRTASNDAFTFFLDSAGFIWISGAPQASDQPIVSGYYGGWLWSPALTLCLDAIRVNLPWVDLEELARTAFKLRTKEGGV